MIAAAWLSSLVQFDADIVIETCREWWENYSRRPVLADIVKLCRENRAIAEEKAKVALPPPEGVPAWFSGDRDMVLDWTRPEDNGDIRIAFRRRCETLAASKAKLKRGSSVEEEHKGRELLDLWAQSQGYVDFQHSPNWAAKSYKEPFAWVTAQAKPQRIAVEAGETLLPPRVKEKVRAESIETAKHHEDEWIVEPAE